MSILADQLRELRARAGWRLSDLAEQTGYSESYLSEIERGRRASLDTTLAIINRILDCYGLEAVVEVRSKGGADGRT
jgi:transcriptional regulator with XRE-family HTH domain